MDFQIQYFIGLLRLKTKNETIKELIQIALYQLNQKDGIKIDMNKNIVMEACYNIKNVQANLDFLKKFEGKKTLITRKGLLSSLDFKPISASKIEVNQDTHVEMSNKKENVSRSKKKLKRLATEPFPSVSEISLQCENINRNSSRNSLQKSLCLQKKTQNLRINQPQNHKEWKLGDRSFDVSIKKHDSYLELNQLKRLPKMQNNNYQNVGDCEKMIQIFSNQNHNQKRSKSLIQSERKKTIDNSIYQHLKELQKFQLRIRTRKNVLA